MNYISSAEAAKRWGVTPRWVSNLARQGRIKDAKRIGHSWMIPEKAKMPKDERFKAKGPKGNSAKAGAAKGACGKAGSRANKRSAQQFSCSFFEYVDPATIDPPLGEEELILKKAAEAFHACKFDKAREILGDFPVKASNRYLRISALYESTMLSILECDEKTFIDYYGRLQAELQEDFPHRAEMEELIHLIDSNLGKTSYYFDTFKVQPGYDYDECFLPELAMLGSARLTFPHATFSPSDIMPHEINCALLKGTDALIPYQMLHLNLGIGYDSVGLKKERDHHIREALKIAKEHDALYAVSIQFYYLNHIFKPALMDFPLEFQKKLTRHSVDIHRRYIKFMERISMGSIYNLLSHKDFIYMYYAVQGLTNKEVADMLHLSVGTVGKRYSEIYAEVGVNNKAELIELYHKLDLGK